MTSIFYAVIALFPWIIKEIYNIYQLFFDKDILYLYPPI